MKPHDTHPDWLVDGRGHVWRKERVFGCEHHPYGPPTDEHGDEHVACATIVRGLWDELGTSAAIETVTGCTPEQIEAAHQELGLCCAGERWRNTGRLIEVGAFEQFVYTAMPPRVAELRDRLNRSVLLDEINRAGAAPWQGTDGQQVRIPLILGPVVVGTPLPLSDAAKTAAGYKLDPSIPPTVE